jgi:hypothetical protein
VDAHGGSVQCESPPSGGATFSMLLPHAEAERTPANAAAGNGNGRGADDGAEMNLLMDGAP